MLNLFLLIFVIVLATVLAATKSFTSAQTTTVTNPTSTTSNSLTTSSTVSPQTVNLFDGGQVTQSDIDNIGKLSSSSKLKLSSIDSKVPSGKIESSNSADTTLEMIPRNDFGKVNEYIDGSNSFTNIYKASFNVKTTMNIVPDASQLIIDAAITPGCNYRNQIIQKILDNMRTNNETKTPENYIKEFKNLASNVNTTYSQFNGCFSIRNDQLFQNQYFNTILDTKPISDYANQINLNKAKVPSNVLNSLSTPLTNILNKTNNTNQQDLNDILNSSYGIKGREQNKLFLPDASMDVSDARTQYEDGGEKRILSGSPIIFDASVGLTDFLANTGSYQDINEYYPVAIDSETPVSDMRYSFTKESMFQVDKPTLQPQLTSLRQVTYPINPFVITSVQGGDVSGGITAPRAFASAAARDSYWNSLNQDKQAQLAGYSSYAQAVRDGAQNSLKSIFDNGKGRVNPNDIGVKMVNGAFWQEAKNPALTMADSCYETYLTSNYDCPQISFNKKFAREDPELSFRFSGLIGYPSGQADWVKYINDLTTFPEQLKPNALSLGNTFTNGTYNVDINLSIDPSGCKIAGGCQRIGSSPISGSLACIGCGFMEKYKANFSKGDAVVTDNQSNGKTNIPKNMYDYAINGKFQYGYITGNNDGLSSSTDTDGYPNTFTLYNKDKLVEASRNGEIIPLAEELGQALNKRYNTTKYTNYNINFNGRLQQLGNIGGINVSKLDSSTFYGILPMSSDDADIWVAFMAKGKDLYNLQISAIILSNFKDIYKNPLIPKSNWSNYDETTSNINVYPTSGISTIVYSGCSTKFEVFHTTLDLADGLNAHNWKPQTQEEISKGMPSHSYYTRSIPAYYNISDNVSDTQASKIKPCNQLNTNDLEDFSNSYYWSAPIRMDGGTILVTPSLPDSSNNNKYFDPNVEKELLAIHKEDGGILTFSYGQTTIDRTYWSAFDPSEPNGVWKGNNVIEGPDFGNDLTVGQFQLHKMRNELNVSKDLGTDRFSFTSKIDLSGKRYVVANSADKVVVYSWASGFPTAQNITKNIYSLSQMTNGSIKPNNFVKPITIDINPNNGHIAIGMNLQYYGVNIQSSKDPRSIPISYTAPVVLEQTDYGFVIHEMDQYKLEALYDDHTAWRINKDDQKAVMNPIIQQVKWTQNGSLTGFINFIGNMSRRVIISRDESDQLVSKCDFGDFTRYFNLNDLKPNCSNDVSNLYKLMPQLKPSVTNSPIFGNITNIDDFYNIEKKIGKDAYDNMVNEVNYSITADNSNSNSGNTGPNSGSDQRPSEDYAIELWSLRFVPIDVNAPTNEINESFCNSKNYISDTGVTRPFACDKYDTALKDKLKAMSKNSNKSLVDDICNVGSAYGVSCALLVSIWGQETQYGTDGAPLTDRAPLGCDLSNILGDSWDSGGSVTNNARCAARSVIRFWYNASKQDFQTKGYATQEGTGQFAGNVIKFAEPFTYTMSRYTPLDPRINADNQNNEGLVIKQNGQIVDTRINLRRNLNGGKELIPISTLQAGDVTSPIDPRIIFTTKFYKGSNTGTVIANHVDTSKIQYLVDLGDGCEAARSLSKTTTLAGVKTIDYKDTMTKCLGANAVSEQFLTPNSKPTYIVMHDSVASAILDYVNISESHKYAYDLITKSVNTDPKFKWSEPTYHVYIRRDGTIEWGQSFERQSVHANGICGTQSCNVDSIGISLEGGFTGSDYLAPPNAASMDSAIKLVKYLQTTYNIPTSNVVGHCEVQPTEKIDTVYEPIDKILQSQGIIKPTSYDTPDQFAAANNYCKKSSQEFRNKLNASTSLNSNNNSYAYKIDE